MCTFDFGEIKLTPFICSDLRLPEIFRQVSASGTGLYLVIANWPAGEDHHWRTLLQARAAFPALKDASSTDASVIGPRFSTMPLQSTPV